MDLDVMLSQQDRHRKMLHGIAYRWDLKKIKLIETEGRRVVARAWEAEETGRVW